MSKKTNKRHRDQLPAEHKGSSTKNIQLAQRASFFQGPLPPPETLEKYNLIVPGAAERILAMAEAQARHRQQLELKVVDSDIRNARTGLHYGLVIGLVSIIGGVLCIWSGHEIGGSILGGVGLSGLVGVFVYGSRQKAKEREKRLEMMTKGAGAHQES